MDKRNMFNGGCCLDATERRIILKEYNKIEKILSKLFKRFIKSRDAKSAEEIAHVIWDIAWDISESMIFEEMAEYYYGAEVEAEYSKIKHIHEKFVCETNKRLGYHLNDETGRWVK